MKKYPVCLLLDYQFTRVCLQLDAPFLTCFIQIKKIYIYLQWTDVVKCVFVSDYWNDYIDDILFM